MPSCDASVTKPRTPMAQDRRATGLARACSDCYVAAGLAAPSGAAGRVFGVPPTPKTTTDAMKPASALMTGLARTIHSGHRPGRPDMSPNAEPIGMIVNMEP